MKENSTPNPRAEILKLCNVKHLDNDDFQHLSRRKLDKKSMVWIVLHLSECRQCCLLASVLTVPEIRETLAGTQYDKPGFIQQTIDYYFQTLTKAK